jgi:hypothetical protein
MLSGLWDIAEGASTIELLKRMAALGFQPANLRIDSGAPGRVVRPRDRPADG